MSTSERATLHEINGVDVDQLAESIRTIRSDPGLGQFEFRASGQWIDAGLNRTTISDFHGAGEEHRHPTPFVLDADEPPVLCGKGRGANPVEYLLKALSACVTTSIVFHAAARGIEVRALRTSLEGDLDVRGFLGLTDEVPKGYQGLRLSVEIDADAPAEQLEELARFSPVLDSLSRPLPVALRIVTR